MFLSDHIQRCNEQALAGCEEDLAPMRVHCWSVLQRRHIARLAQEDVRDVLARQNQASSSIAVG
jgi:hypothetical protein